MPVALGVLREELLTAETADETVSKWVDCRGYAHLTVYARGTGTVSSGVITIEEADFNPSKAITTTDTASAIDTVTASALSGGVQVATHLDVGAYMWVRTRISTVIGGGGSVSTVLVGY